MRHVMLAGCPLRRRKDACSENLLRCDSAALSPRLPMPAPAGRSLAIAVSLWYISHLVPKMQAKIDREKQIEILRGRLAESVKKRNDTVFHPSGIKYNHAGTSRDRFEAGEPLANPFQIDKARIVMCKAFRRLKHKTQVFWSPRNDHFRTRLTHTIELAQTADLIGSLLGLNTDLIEAIAFGHD